MKKLLLLGLVLSLLPVVNLEAKTNKRTAGKNSQSECCSYQRSSFTSGRGENASQTEWEDSYSTHWRIA